MTDAVVVEPTTELVPYTPLELTDFTIGPIGLTVKQTPTFESWAGIGDLLRTVERGIQFVIGDWCSVGEREFGERAAQVIDAKSWSASTVTVYRWVAAHVPPENRRTDLSFSHHMAVADCEPEMQREWLAKAADTTVTGEPWPVAKLKQEVAARTIGGTVTYLLVVEIPDEQARERLASRLESEGLTCKRAEATRKRAPKAGPVTARKRGPGKMSANRRKPN